MRRDGKKRGIKSSKSIKSNPTRLLRNQVTSTLTEVKWKNKEEHKEQENLNKKAARKRKLKAGFSEEAEECQESDIEMEIFEEESQCSSALKEKKKAEKKKLIILDKSTATYKNRVVHSVAIEESKKDMSKRHQRIAGDLQHRFVVYDKEPYHPHVSNVRDDKYDKCDVYYKEGKFKPVFKSRSKRNK